MYFLFYIFNWHLNPEALESQQVHTLIQKSLLLGFKKLVKNMSKKQGRS